MTNDKKESTCKTPGAIYKTKINKQLIAFWVTLPDDIVVSEDDAKQIEDDLHDLLEAKLAFLWNK